MKNKKLGIIVPYRDRQDQLKQFVKEVSDYFHYVMFDIEYEIFIIEQGDKKSFNRGKLLNIGFIIAEQAGCDYVVFHDIDLMPRNADYSYSKVPIQLANRFEAWTAFKRTINDDYFGGVTMFPKEVFRKINGYSNKYRGWGFEDNDLLYRCDKAGVQLFDKKYRCYSENTKSLKFDGESSMIEIPNTFTFARPISFYASFQPGSIVCNKKEITDEYAIFSIPGEDLNLSYNSFRTFKFELFLVNSDIISITTKTLPNMPCRAVVTIDPKDKTVKFYLNGLKIGVGKWPKYGIRKYSNEPLMYLGVGDPNRPDKNKWFNGSLDEFAVFKKELSDQEIRELTVRGNTLLTDTYTDGELATYYRADSTYTSKTFRASDKVTGINSMYDTKMFLRDLSGNGNDGKVYNCDVIDIKQQREYTMKTPIRRPGKFMLLPHEEQGYTSGYWKNWRSRENQIMYYDILNNDKEDYLNDGLNNCRYKILGIKNSTLGELHRSIVKHIIVRT